MARPLAEVVVIVLGADTDVGRAVALAIAGRGAHVVVVGGHERALGEVVGEIAHAGGSARHAVGGVAEGEAKAEATWGKVDFVAGHPTSAAVGRPGREHPEPSAAAPGSPDSVAKAVVDALVDIVAERGRETGGAIT